RRGGGARDGRDARRRHRHRLHDPPPGPRAPCRRRDRLPRPGARHGTNPRRAFLHRTEVAAGGRLPRRRVAMNAPLARLIARFATPWIVAALALAGAPPALAGDFITVASTTSTEQSGLFKYLLPEAKKALGFDVHVVAVGTGQALDMARRGDADVVFVHDKVAEEKFLAEGYGVKRYEVMYNDFVIVGPKADPAHAKGNDVVEALKKIAHAQAPFASRGDKSGTDAAE